MKENNINELIFRFVSGIISDDEMLTLQRKCQENPDLLADIEAYMERTDLTRAYHIYKGIDDKAARARLRQRIFRDEPGSASSLFRMSWRKWVAAASVVLLLAYGGIRYSSYTEIVPPELSEEVITAMQLQNEFFNDNDNYNDNVNDDDNFNVNDNDNDDVNDDDNYNVNGVTNHFTIRRSRVSEEDLSSFALTPDKVDDLLSQNKIETRRSSEHWLTLDDGTVVHLSSDSRIIYPEHFASPRPFSGKITRDVYVEGEAYFMVAHDSRRPFIVHTPHGSCIDYGTEFFLSSKNDALRVALIKGDVGVTPKGYPETRLTPGCELYHDKTGFSVKQIDVSKYTAWNTGKYEFYDQSLREIIDVLSRWYEVKPVYASNVNADAIHLMGSFNKFGDINSALRTIEMSAGVKISKEGSKVFISN